ncbi:lysophospholipid acyltransferase family protein [Chitiniphilus purpureus]|uniref:Lysophospholipid acyltransferase family protein n=1 Tax=Chitiniphilus purpureus TaxID=2981137 RepID=A0ABY6DLT0_9NEIS|nr:lysophospholipid acyltransferase family protein [Chitiniphilus sp. CD1]UXY15297.1 lysophospholipid acyltransferase family protein [Chitiniphilus sp. CD1]
MLVALFKPLAWLPLPLFHVIGAALGWLVYWASPGYRRRIAENLRQSGLAQSDGDYRRLLRASIAAHGMGALELIPAWLRPLPRVATMVKQCTGWAHVTAALESPAPLLLVSPHLGAIEVCGAYLASRLPRPLTALYRPPKLAWLEPLMLSSRTRGGARAAPANAGGVRQLFKALKQGQAVYMLPDQAPGAGEGVWAPFFGRPAYTMTLLSRLACASHATVLLCCAERLSWGRGYRIHIRPLSDRFSGEAQADAALLNADIEALIRLAPAQYLWSYNRYKRPAGAPLPGDAA